MNKQEHVLHTKPNDIKSYVNSYVHFRREINLEDSFSAEPFFISADGRYKLYINGELAGRGPARCHPQKQYVDRYDINPFLKKGRNIIAVLVHTYGKDMSWYEMPVGLQLDFFGCGGLFCQGDIETGGKKLLIDTGYKWKYKQSEAWQKDVPSGGTGYTEYYDFNRSLPGWNSSGYKDDGWFFPEILRLPFPLGGSDIVPFTCLVERDIPFLEEKLIFPDVLVRTAETEEMPDENASLQVRREELETLSSCRIEENGGTLEVTTSEGRAVVMLYDFGRIICGRVDLEVVSPANAVIDIAYGERLTKQKGLFLPPDVPGISIAQVHRVRLKDGVNQFQQFEMAGFRYLKLTIRNSPLKMLLKHAGVMSCCYPSTQKGSFSCSDPVLNKVWEAGDYTVRMCSIDSFMDCPTREQRQWIGDVFVESQVNLVTEKDTRLIRKYLRQVAETQKPDGMVMMATTSDLDKAKSVFVPDFAILWILTAENYLKYTGDLETINKIFQAMVKLIEWFRFYLDENNLLCNLPGWTFIDWSMELERNGEVAVLNALYFGALKAVSKLADQLGFGRLSKEYTSLSGDVKKAVNETFWDDERGVYIDACVDGIRGRVVSQHANAAVIYFNVAPKQRWASIFDSILDEDRVKLTKTWRWDKERPFNPEEDIIMVQPFYSVFLHGALANAGNVNLLLENIKSQWGPMVEISPTLWESWQLTDITSTCHGFSASPTYFLSTLILGVSPLGNGFKRFRIKIPDCDINWAKGAVPTPIGMISVEWKRTDQEIIAVIDVPEGLEGEVVFPSGFDTMPRILFAGSHSLRVGKQHGL